MTEQRRSPPAARISRSFFGGSPSNSRLSTLILTASSYSATAPEPSTAPPTSSPMRSPRSLLLWPPTNRILSPSRTKEDCEYEPLYFSACQPSSQPPLDLERRLYKAISAAGQRSSPTAAR